MRVWRKTRREIDDASQEGIAAHDGVYGCDPRARSRTSCVVKEQQCMLVYTAAMHAPERELSSLRAMIRL